MVKRGAPGIDRAIEPEHGVTREGQPLSYNRAPAPDLAPWIGRLYATKVDAPSDHRLDCGLFNDTSVFRMQLKGRWEAKTADGLLVNERAALYFGPHTRLMPVSVTGSFISVGFALRPGTGHALLGAKTADYIDRIVPCEEMGLPGNATLDYLAGCKAPEECLQKLENVIRKIVANSGAREPDPITSKFEEMTFVDPTASISEFARDIGVDQRKLERTVRRDFGMAPKQVMRRARALDMAAYLRGVADQDEAEDLTLRYYDQSHLIREFTELFGMSPRQFVAAPLPILTLALESRQAHRLEAIERIAPGARRPWEKLPELSRKAS